MTRIFIEDNELDINAGFSQMINYSIDDLNNLDSKTTSFTKTIVLPGTSKNNRLLGNIFEFANSNYTVNGANVNYNFNASKSAKARIEVNGLQVIKGTLRLLEIIIDGEFVEYEVALFGELGGFFSKLGASKLTDLDFSAYNHQYNVTNIESSWNNAGNGSGYYYPLIDYGNTSPTNDANFFKKSFYYTAFRPAFFVREYINKIITSAGYTWESNFFNTNFFKRLIVPNNQSRLAYKKTRIFNGVPSGTIGGGGVPIINQLESNFTTADNKTWTYTGAQTFSGSVNLKLAGTWRISNQAILGNKVVRFNLYKNGVFLCNDNTIFGTPPSQIGGLGNATTNVPFSFSVNYAPFNSFFTLATNDTFSVTMDSISGTDAISVNITGISMTLDGSPTLTPANYNDNLIVSDSLPKGILQKDFFASILKMFNLMVTEDRFTEKKLVIEPYVDFYDLSRASYNDWSDKVDRSQVIKIKPMSEINARYYDIKFKQDADNFNEQYRKKFVVGYGDYRFDNQLEFAKDTSTTEVIFSASPLVGYTGNDKIFPAIYKLNNTTEEMIEHNIRIMQAKKITGRTSWKIYSSAKVFNVPVSYGTYTAYGYAGHLDDPFNPASDLNFGIPEQINFNLTTGTLSNNLFNTYYSPYFAEITDKDSRLVTCKMKLMERDINTLDFTKFIWIDGVLYRLYKIVDYSEGELCEVQLLRVIYTTY
jgi:hypothetical protein